MLKVSVLTDSRLEGCEADCTSCWASRQPLPEVLRRIEERFARQVSTEYLDLADPGVGARYAAVAATAKEHSLPYPLLVIGGQLHLAGCFDYRMVAETVEAQLEIEGI